MYTTILACVKQGKLGEMDCISLELIQVLYLVLRKIPKSKVSKHLGTNKNLLCIQVPNQGSPFKTLDC